MSRMKKFLLLMVGMLFITGFSLGEALQPIRSVRVSSYEQLLKAVNDDGAEEILIAAGYQHGTSHVGESLHPSGCVTIRSEQGQSITVTGRFDISAGTIIFDRVNLAAPSESTALYVSGNASVTACCVTGGSSNKGIGGSGLEAIGPCTVTLDEATGGSGLTMGGDGVYAMNGAKVTVRTATGGSSQDGYGGAGVAACGASVTVTDNSAGGAGKRVPGTGLLIGLGGRISVLGTVTDGKQLGVPDAVPSKADNYADLLYMLRRGDTSVALSSHYKHGTAPDLEKPWFISGSSAVSVKGSGAVLKSRVSLCGGGWSLDGISIKPDGGASALVVSGDTDIEIGGKLTASGSGFGLIVTDQATARVNGTITGLVAVTGSGTASIEGKIKHTDTKHPNALMVADSAELNLTGNVSGSVLCAGSSKLTITGGITANKGNALKASGAAQVKISGSLKGSSKTEPALTVSGQSTVEIGGSVNASKNTNAVTAYDQCKVTISGSVKGGTKGTSVPTVWQQGQRVTVKGKVSGSVFTR